MVRLKQLVVSLILPISVVIVIPFIISVLVDHRILYFSITFKMHFLIPGVILGLLGLYLFITCILLFYRIGKGTLMPVSKIQTRRLVIAGPYKYVRNPMIISVILIVLGEGLIFESLSIILFDIAFFIVNLIYIPLVEEKGISERFGEEYLQYKKQVWAWFPKFRAYDPSDKKQDDQ